MNKHQAIKAASSAVTLSGSGTSWVIRGPYNHGQIGGPYTERQADSYAKARTIRARWAADIACSLLGMDGEEIIFGGDYPANVRVMVDAVVRAQNGQTT